MTATIDDYDDGDDDDDDDDDDDTGDTVVVDDGDKTYEV